MVAALLVTGAVVAVAGGRKTPVATGSATPTGPGTPSPGAEGPGTNHPLTPVPLSPVPSPRTSGGARSFSAEAKPPALPAGGTSSSRAATLERAGVFRVTSLKVYLTSTSYRVAMSTAGGPPWTPFSLTVTAGAGLTATGADGRPVMIDGDPPHSYGGSITHHTTCTDWTITATIAPGPAAPGGLTDTGLLQQAC